MPSLNRNEKVICDNCCTQTTKPNLACHRKRCSVGTLYCTQCPNFSTKFQSDLIYLLPRGTAPRNLISLSSVNFVIKSFQVFTLYVNIETLNMECRSDQEQEMWTWNTQWEMLRSTVWEKSCVPVNISRWMLEHISRILKERDTKYSITQWKLSMKQWWTRILIIFSTI